MGLLSQYEGCPHISGSINKTFPIPGIGTLIHPKFILTSTECVQPGPRKSNNTLLPDSFHHKYPVTGTLQNVIVRIGGTLDIMEPVVAQIVVPKENIYRHESYDWKNIETPHIALIQLVDENYGVQFDNGYRFPTYRVKSDLEAITSRLPSFPSSKPGVGQMITVAGWNDQTIRVPFVDERTCARWTGLSFSEYEMCLGYERGGKDRCVEDIGGPAYSRSGGGLVLHGIVKDGFSPCAQAMSPGVYIGEFGKAEGNFEFEKGWRISLFLRLDFTLFPKLTVSLHTHTVTGSLKN